MAAAAAVVRATAATAAAAAAAAVERALGSAGARNGIARVSRTEGRTDHSARQWGDGMTSVREPRVCCGEVNRQSARAGGVW